MRIIISGGGTGGHIFPAIAVANELSKKLKNIEILFVGAKGKMEMEKVPAVGYNIIGLPVRGFQRRISFQNILVIINLIRSMIIARKIIKTFKPDIAVGFGGYASGPVLKAAAARGIKTALQEQNSYAGVTNKLLAKTAAKIFVAYENMDKFFEPEKIVLTGNPIRQDIVDGFAERETAINYFELNTKKKTILILGGSGGAKTINQSIVKQLDTIKNSEYQFILQTGKNYLQQVIEAIENHIDKNIIAEKLKVHCFISRMDLAYSCADLVVSRAGAISISELCVVGKPVILVPSPNVAEDHQTKNANALVNNNAAVLITDTDAEKILLTEAINTLNNNILCTNLAKNIKKLAKPNAAEIISNQIIMLCNE